MILVMRCMHYFWWAHDVFIGNLSDTPSSLAAAQTPSWQNLWISWVNSWRPCHWNRHGLGWFAIYAATQYGCRVTTTTTISDAQYEEANAAFAANLTDKITLLKQDYRELTGAWQAGQYWDDSVGHEYLPDFLPSVIDCSKIMGWWYYKQLPLMTEGIKIFACGGFYPNPCFPRRCLLF